MGLKGEEWANDLNNKKELLLKMKSISKATKLSERNITKRPHKTPNQFTKWSSPEFAP
jgi:hypothetical protein